jgi:hypothetical protein
MTILGWRRGARRRHAAEDRERRVAEALAVTAVLQAVQEEKACKRAARPSGKGRPDSGKTPAEATAEKEPRASTPDPQARVMKMADGGFRPAYNVQFAADTGSGAVAGVAVDNVGSDMGKMAPMNEALAAAYGTRPAEHLADGGFAKLDDIEALAEAGVVTYVPVPAPRDRHAPRTDDRGLAPAHGGRGGQGHLQGPRRDRRMR